MRDAHSKQNSSIWPEQKEVEGDTLEKETGAASGRILHVEVCGSGMWNDSFSHVLLDLSAGCGTAVRSLPSPPSGPTVSFTVPLSEVLCSSLQTSSIHPACLSFPKFYHIS